MTPKPVPTESVKTVAAGDGVSAAITAAGRLLTWGRNGAGQLAQKGTVPAGQDLLKPARSRQVDGRVIAVDAGLRHLVVLTWDAQVLTFGADAAGNDLRRQVTIRSSWGKVRAISAGEDHTLALTNRGLLIGWGANDLGQLGVADRQHKLVPVLVPLPGARGKVTQFWTGHRHSLALTDQHEIFAWGEGRFGAIGTGQPTPDTTTYPTPQRIDLRGVKPTGLGGGGYNSAVFVDRGPAVQLKLQPPTATVTRRKADQVHGPADRRLRHRPRTRTHRRETRGPRWHRRRHHRHRPRRRNLYRHRPRRHPPRPRRLPGSEVRAAMTTTTCQSGRVPANAPFTPDPQASPFQHPPAFSRRTLLAGILGLGLGAYLDASPLTSWTAFASPPTVVAGNLPPQPTPFAVTASSELSDDAFATADVLIGDEDAVLPFYNPFSKTDEALVFSGGNLNHLRRDPTQATGWAYTAFDLQQTLTSITSVAVAANNTQVYVLLLGNPDEYNNPSGSPYWLTWLDDAVTWNEGFVAPLDDQLYPPDPGPLKGGISRDGTPYFYSASVSGTTVSLLTWATTGDLSNPLGYLDVLDADVNTGLQDFFLLYDTNPPTDPNGPPTGFAFLLTTDGLLNVYAQQGTTFPTSPMSDAGTSGVTELMWAWSSPGSTTGLPGYAIQGTPPTLEEGTFFCDENGNFAQVADLPGPGPSVVSVWLLNDLYTVNLLDTNGVLQTIQQSGPGTWADPLPLTNGVPGSPKPGLVAVYGVATDPTRSTLFAIGADESLSVLSLDDSGWTQTQVQQSNTVGVQLSCYRLTISVVDSNGSPVRYGQAQLAADRPVGLWQDIGSTIITPSTPVTMTSDIHGQIIVSVPAEEIDVAQLTVQAVNPDNSLSTAQAVASDYDVRNFMAGTAPLTSVGPMSATTLSTAQNSDGTLLMPDLGDNASGLVTGLSSAITAGNGGPPAAGQPHAYRFELDGKKLKVATSHDPHAFGTAPRPELNLSLSHAFDSIGHALRHDVAKIVTAVVKYVDGWIVDLETTISDLASYAINDMKDAFHVISGWFITFGADIVKAVKWLQREIFDFLSSVGANATTISTVLAAAPANLTTIINGIKREVDGWFAQQEVTVAGWIGELATAVEDATFGSSQPLTSPPTDTGSSTAENGLPKDIHWIFEVVNDCPGKWLYDKLMQHLPKDPGPDLSGVFDTAIDDLATAFTDSTDLATGIVHTIWDLLKGLTDASKVTEVEMATWFNGINGIAQDVLKLCDAIADTVLDFVTTGLSILGDYLSYRWSLTSIDPILKLILDKLGYDPKITLDRLVSLAIGFPLTLVRSIRGDSPVFSTNTAAKRASNVGGPADTIESFFYTIAAVSQFIWTGADVIGDLELLVEQGESSRPQAPGIIDYYDILCPIAENVFLLPGFNDDLIWTGFPTDANLPQLIAPAVITALITPIFKIAQKAGYVPSGPSDPDVVQYYDNAPVMKNALAQYYGPVVSMTAGVANTVLSSMYSDKNSSSTSSAVNSIFASVLGNASNIGAPLTTWWLNDSLEDVPVAVKVVIDGVAGSGAGIAYAVAAADA